MAELNVTDNKGDSLLAEYAAQKRVELIPAMIYVGFIITAGVVGNAFTIVYYGFNVKRTPSSVFISTLAVIDLATCIILSNQIIHMYHVVTFKSVVGCKVLYFVNYWFIFCSVFMLVIISIDRYRKLCTPFKRQFTMLSLKVAICTAIGTSLLLAIKGNFIVDVHQVHITNKKNETFEGYHCSNTLKPNTTMRDLVTAFHLIDLTIPFMVAVYFIIIYGLIIRNIVRLKRKNSVNDRNTPEVKITLLMIIITIGLVVSYLPYFVIVVYVNLVIDKPVYELNVGYQIVYRLFILNNAINPYVFLMFNSAYRCFVRHVFKQCTRCKE